MRKDAANRKQDLRRVLREDGVKNKHHVSTAPPPRHRYPFCIFGTMRPLQPSTATLRAASVIPRVQQLLPPVYRWCNHVYSWFTHAPSSWQQTLLTESSKSPVPHFLVSSRLTLAHHTCQVETAARPHADEFQLEVGLVHPQARTHTGIDT
jgi:hypothetical protein